jgi:phenylacetate-CoA ligase
MTSPANFGMTPVLDRAQLAQVQWAKLSKLVERAYAQSPFYRQRLDQAGAQPYKIKNLDYFCKAVPLLRKEDVLRDQVARPPYGERLCVDPTQIVQINTTGGTSGKGREIYGLTPSDLSLVSDLYARGCIWAGVRPGDVVAMTFPMSLGAAPIWIYHAFLGLHTNVMCLGTYDTQTRLRQMREFGTRVLVATPTYIETLAKVAAVELNWDVKKDLRVELILMATEAFSLDRVRRIEKTWDAKVHEWYGASQRIVAWNCQCGALQPNGSRGLLHHFPDAILMETINPVTHEPVSDGEEGEVVATCLDIEASPLLRFATGDRVRFMPARSCQCGLPLDGYESGTVTRYDDMIKVRGVNIWPIATDEMVFSEPGVRNYIGRARTQTDGSEEVILEVEFDEKSTPERREETLKRLAGKLRSGLGLRVEVRQAIAPLPRFEDTLTKAKRWRDERAL